jgi:hypothetical protein
MGCAVKLTYKSEPFMVAQLSILQRCFEEAATSSARALERCIDEAVLSLQAEEAGAVKVIVRDRLALAWNSLLKQRPNWPPAYAAGLRAAFRAAARGRRAVRRRRRPHLPGWAPACPALPT